MPRGAPCLWSVAFGPSPGRGRRPRRLADLARRASDLPIRPARDGPLTCLYGLPETGGPDRGVTAHSPATPGILPRQPGPRAWFGPGAGPGSQAGPPERAPPGRSTAGPSTAGPSPPVPPDPPPQPQSIRPLGPVLARSPGPTPSASVHPAPRARPRPPVQAAGSRPRRKHSAGPCRSRLGMDGAGRSPPARARPGSRRPGSAVPQPGGRGRLPIGYEQQCISRPARDDPMSIGGYTDQVGGEVSPVRAGRPAGRPERGAVAQRPGCSDASCGCLRGLPDRDRTLPASSAWAQA
jgi:hypothetical protein